MALVAGAALLSAASSWLSIVHQYLPEAYLDEVFHVPQAQAYCAGHWTVWDPKITTPPGLYLIAAVLRPLFGCSTIALRAENALCVAAIAVIVRLILGQRPRSAHHAVNIALFPPLFFFSALYYTDIASTFSVLLFHFIRRTRGGIGAKATANLFTQILFFVLGIASLSFRQTNIFWVAILPAAETLLTSIDTGHAVVKESMYKGAAGFGDSLFSIVKTSWKLKVIYDPPMANASLTDYLSCIISGAACLLATLSSPANASRVIFATAPYAALILAFATFILWNGSVVLGDKSNHVATLHLPQMLYIWPYITFFSWPLILPIILKFALSFLPSAMVKRVPLAFRPGNPTKQPGIRYLLLFIPLSVLAVKYNTIVHPFTLADNRHYTFYVFRLLMRPWWIRYLAVPIYALCAWACIQSLGYAKQSNQTPRSLTSQHLKDAQRSTNANASGPTVSFVLIWLATTALQLITAPLVEPRYFILPWIFWRLAVAENASSNAALADPAVADATSPRQAQKAKKRLIIAEPRRNEYDDYRLWIETAWLLLVNIITGYIFIHWKFTWHSEPGKWQRFMW